MATSGDGDRHGAQAWPALPLEEWAATRDTLLLWTQVVGKVRLANTPIVNHWWNVPLYVTARGFGTSLVHHPSGPSFEVDFDLIDHHLQVSTTDGRRRALPLTPQPVGELYSAVMGTLDELGLHTEIWPVPVEIPGAVAFTEDTEHVAYDPGHAHRFWLALVQMDRVLTEFRARYLGKSSPVHLFWGALDLAVTRFSGHAAPPHPGGAPNCGPHVMLEAYSHEVSSCGYWPGGGPEGVFYAYAYPEPAGFRDAPAGPPEARYDEELGEFVLPYEAVRTAPDPDAVLLDFLQRTYEAAADAAGWDRASLERQA